MMSDQENFIARWSRRKREATYDAEVAKSAEAPGGPEVSAEAGEPARPESDPAPGVTGVPPPSETAFDATTLPSIDTINAATDVRAFLAPGVPAELTRAALRRAWASDPSIRDFVGLSENSWDFNAPETIGGFGQLEITDELKAQITRMLGSSGGDSAKAAPNSLQVPSTPSQRGIESAETAAAPSGSGVEIPTAAERTQKSAESDAPDALPQCSESPDALHNDLESSGDKPYNDQLLPRRPHGRALPT
jgi:hypothetical protein